MSNELTAGDLKILAPKEIARILVSQLGLFTKFEKMRTSRQGSILGLKRAGG